LKDEISWEELRRESGYPHDITEMTSVTNKVRRVGRFDWELAKKAVLVNGPTRLAINGLDYLDHHNFGLTHWTDLSERAACFVSQMEHRLGVGVEFLGVGPALNNIILHGENQAGRETEHAETVLP
jgi:adenylosuccinate synthase